MKLIAQGAEGKIFDTGDAIVKERFRKGYRIEEIDKKLRRSRTRREAKVLGKLKELGIPAPSLLSVDDKTMKITMEKIEGKKLRDVFSSNIPLAFDVGKKVGQMHSNKIIHADLTTSNMLVKDDIVYFIDFGLSFFSDRIEDRAVDLHLFERAVESFHYPIKDEVMKQFFLGYKEGCSQWEMVLKRLDVVQGRGRHKKK